MPGRVEHGFVDTSLGQMHVLSRQSRPTARTIVLVHQVPSSHLMWRAVMDRLAAVGAACMAVDLPGFGFSERPVRPPSVEAYGAAVGEALPRLLDGSCLIVGHHFGSMVAVEVANRQRPLVHAVAGYGIPLVSEERRRALASEAFARLDPDGDEVAAYWRSRRKRSGASGDVEHTRRSLIEWLLAGDYAVWGHRVIGDYDARGALRRLRQPLLGIAGGREDLYEETRRATEEAPGGRFRSLGTAGIDVADTHVEEFCEALMELDRSVQGSS